MTAPTTSLPAADRVLVDEENPWPGLAAFREAEEAFFRGRARQIDALERTVQLQRVTVLYGVSGLGKTSLLQAGLFPRVRHQDELPVYVRLDFSGQPADLMEQLATALRQQAAQSGIEAPIRHPGQPLWCYLHRRDTAFWGPRNRRVIPIFVLDQFEEVFSLGRAQPQWRERVDAFLVDLSDLVEGRPPQPLREEIDTGARDAAAYDFNHHPYRVLVSLREDYLAEIDSRRDLMPSLGQGRLRLLPMSGQHALEVVDQTNGRLIETDVARAVVWSAAGRPGNASAEDLDEVRVDPSLLSLLCHELNNHRRAAGLAKITRALVEDTEANILEHFYEDRMALVDPALRRYVEEQLLTGRGQRDSRMLEDALAQPGISREDVDRLIDARLLRVETMGGAKRLELTHDVLTRVARASRNRRQERERAAAEQAAAREELERTLLDERDRSARRTWLFGLTALTLGLVAIGFAGVAWYRNQAAMSALQFARLEAERAAASALAAQAAQTAAKSALNVAATTVADVAANPHTAATRVAEAESALAEAQRAIAPPDESAPANDIAPRVYLQVQSPAARAEAKLATDALENVGFVVPGIEQLKVGPKQTEVRYFRRAEKDGAEKVAATLEQAGIPVETKYVAGYESSPKIRLKHYEVWFGGDVRG